MGVLVLEDCKKEFPETDKGDKMLVDGGCEYVVRKEGRGLRRGRDKIVSALARNCWRMAVGELLDEGRNLARICHQMQKDVHEPVHASCATQSCQKES